MLKISSFTSPIFTYYKKLKLIFNYYFKIFSFCQAIFPRFVYYYKGRVIISYLFHCIGVHFSHQKTYTDN